MHFSIKKGLDVPLAGSPAQMIDDGNVISSVAVLGNEYIGMRPTMLVEEGEQVKHGNMVGFLSEKDCMKVALNANYHGTVGGKVETFMGRGVETIDVDTPIIDVAQKFLDTPYKRFPVVNDNRLVGTITRHELLRALQEVAAPESTRKPANTQSTKQHIHVSSSS